MVVTTEKQLLSYLVRALGLLERTPANGAFLDELNALYHPAVALVHELEPNTAGKWMREVI